jgi:hypothetical protein
VAVNKSLKSNFRQDKNQNIKINNLIDKPSNLPPKIKTNKISLKKPKIVNNSSPEYSKIISPKYKTKSEYPGFIKSDISASIENIINESPTLQQNNDK